MGRRLVERKEEKQTDDDYIYVMRPFAYIFLICGIFFTIIGVLFNLFPEGLEGMTRVWVNVGLFAFCAIVYSFGIECYFYHISSCREKIVYKSLFHREVTLAYTDVKGYERKPNGILQVHMNNDKTISFDREFASIIRIDLECFAGTDKDMENRGPFIVRQARYMRVLSIVVTICMAGFVILAMNYGSFFATVFFFTFLLLGIYSCAYSYSEKYFVGNERIEVHRLFHKKKIIPYTDISKVEMKDGDGFNESIISVLTASSKKPLVKINNYYENSFLLVELAETQGWIA